MMPIKERVIYLAMFSFLMAISVAFAGGENRLDTWVVSHLEKNENVLCQRNIDNDLFFIARMNDKLKAGYLLDVTSAVDVPRPFFISWGFSDEDGRRLETNIPPNDIKRDYVRLADKIYAENIAYRHLHLDGVKKMFVTVKLEKYAPSLDVSESIARLDGSGAEKITICEVSF